MINRIVILLIFTMCMILLIPPMFAKGGVFEAPYSYLDKCGNSVIEYPYANSSFFILIISFAAFVGMIIPFIAPKLNRMWHWISIMSGAWFIAGLTYELVNLMVPQTVFNSFDENWTHNKYVMIFAVGIACIITLETWKKHKRSKKY